MSILSVQKGRQVDRLVTCCERTEGCSGTIGRDDRQRDKTEMENLWTSGDSDGIDTRRTEMKTKRNGAFGKNLMVYTWKEKLVAMVLSTTVPLATLPPVAFALPHGGVVTKGHATLSYSTNSLLIRQSTSSASFSWTGFNVGSVQSVSYKTPGSSSVSMNFIGGTSPATISGKVTSNGILEFMDENGLVFGSGSTVSAAGIRAYGEATPGSAPTGAVTNAGTLTAGTGGQVVLVGTSVTNSGTIDAPSGQVVLVAGSTVTLNESPSSSLSVASTGGGAVIDSGVIRAENLDGTPGAITLEAGMGSGTTTLTQSAVLDASASAGGNGGVVIINASGVVLNNVAPINVSAPMGTKGVVRIDPNLILSGTTLDICNTAGLESVDTHQTSLTIGTTTTDPLTHPINLEANMNLASGGTNYNWTPLGTSSTSAFTGTFNGNGYTVSGYTIMAGGHTGTGFIGYLGTNGVVKNLGVAGTVVGGSFCNIGGVVGSNYGTVKTSYNTGSVSGSGKAIGGVVGTNNGTVETSYNTGSVSGTRYVGGVVGYNFSTGAIVETSYNTGRVSGTNSVGGVVGANFGTRPIVKTSYYLSTSASRAVGVGHCKACSSFTNSSSNSNMTFRNLGSFTGWNATAGTLSTPSATWYIDPGVTTVGSGIAAPVLVSDMPVDTVTGGGTSVYSGRSVATPYTQSVTMGGSALASGITATTAGPTVGTYTVIPTVSLSAAATQTSVVSYNAVSGTWTITTAPLNFSSLVLLNPTMIYDGGTSVVLTPSNSSATLSGFVSGQGATYRGATGTFSSSSPGTHTVTASLTTANFSGTGAGFSWSNYFLPTLALSGTGIIVPANVLPSGSGLSGTGGSPDLSVPPPIDVLESLNPSLQGTPLSAGFFSGGGGGNASFPGENGEFGDGILVVTDLQK